MAIRLGINGFGRIGRSILRALLESGRDDLQVVAINDPARPETLAHLLEYDSVHGRLHRELKLDGAMLHICGLPAIRMSQEPDPALIGWPEVDIVLECTGQLRADTLAAPHLEAGAGKVLISAPASGKIKTIVYGVNHHSITREDRIVSNASCTTNCLVPVAHVLHEVFGIVRGHMTTVHSYTGAQPLHDRAQDDLYRARAAGLSMIPTTTGAAETLGLVLPQLAGRITGTAIRVPTPNVSCIDLVVELDRDADPEAVNAAMQTAADGAMRDVLGVTHRPLVSIDFNHDPRSAIFASDQTAVQRGNLLRALAWYDNEWGFSNRMLDTAATMARAC